MVLPTYSLPLHFLAFYLPHFHVFLLLQSIEKTTYMRVFGFYYIGSALFLLGSIISPLISALGMLVLFVGHILGLLNTK